MYIPRASLMILTMFGSPDGGFVSGLFSSAFNLFFWLFSSNSTLRNPTQYRRIPNAEMVVAKEGKCCFWLVIFMPVSMARRLFQNYLLQWCFIWCNISYEMFLYIIHLPLLFFTLISFYYRGGTFSTFTSFYYRDGKFSTLISFYYRDGPFSTLISFNYRDGTFSSLISFYYRDVTFSTLISFYSRDRTFYTLISFYYRDVTFSTLISFDYRDGKFSTLISFDYRDGKFSTLISFYYRDGTFFYLDVILLPW